MWKKGTDHHDMTITNHWDISIEPNKNNNVCETVQLLQVFCSAMAESWKKLKTSNVFSSFIVCLKRKRSAIVPELLSNYSLLHVRDLL